MMTSWVKKASVLIVEMCRSAAYSSVGDIRSNTSVLSVGGCEAVIQSWLATWVFTFKRLAIFSLYHLALASSHLAYHVLGYRFSLVSLSFPMQWSHSVFYFLGEEKWKFLYAFTLSCIHHWLILLLTKFRHIWCSLKGNDFVAALKWYKDFESILDRF